MSKYADIANRIMEVIGEFPALEELSSEDVDIAFFAKMDLTVALTKAVAGIKGPDTSPVKVELPELPPPPDNKYMYSFESHSLWVANEDVIYHLAADETKWDEVNSIWPGWEELYQCPDVLMLTYQEYLEKLGGRQTAPSDIPF